MKKALYSIIVIFVTLFYCNLSFSGEEDTAKKSMKYFMNSLKRLDDIDFVSSFKKKKLMGTTGFHYFHSETINSQSSASVKCRVDYIGLVLLVNRHGYKVESYDLFNFVKEGEYYGAKFKIKIIKPGFFSDDEHNRDGFLAVAKENGKWKIGCFICNLANIAKK